MSRPPAIPAGLALLAAGALALCAITPATASMDAPAAAAAAPTAAPRIVVEPAYFDFGTLKAGRAVQKEFLVRNHGRADLAIESLVTTCGCTAALTESKTVKPGGSTALRVTFTAPEHEGRLQKSILIKSNDPVRPSLELKIEAVIAGARPRAR